MSETSTAKSRTGAEAWDCAGIFSYSGREPSAAIVQVVARARRARVVRAARTLAACWGLAIAAVFVPVLHFVLVPTLLLAGPLLSLQKLHEAHSMRSASGACPACGAAQQFALGRPWRPRTTLRCEACGRALALELPATPPAS